MENKNNNWKFTMLNILTFGYFKRRLNKRINSENQIKHSESIPFNIDKLIELLGGLENIIETKSTINTIQVFFKDKTKINVEQIKKLGAKGTMINNDKISIVFGDFANELKNQITKKMEQK